MHYQITDARKSFKCDHNFRSKSLNESISVASPSSATTSRASEHLRVKLQRSDDRATDLQRQLRSAQESLSSADSRASQLQSECEALERKMARLVAERKVSRLTSDSSLSFFCLDHTLVLVRVTFPESRATTAVGARTEEHGRRKSDATRRRDQPRNTTAETTLPDSHVSRKDVIVV